jgi:hypothetical protein
MDGGPRCAGTDHVAGDGAVEIAAGVTVSGGDTSREQGADKPMAMASVTARLYEPSTLPETHATEFAGIRSALAPLSVLDGGLTYRRVDRAAGTPRQLTRLEEAAQGAGTHEAAR